MGIPSFAYLQQFLHRPPHTMHVPRVRIEAAQLVGWWDLCFRERDRTLDPGAEGELTGLAEVDDVDPVRDYACG